MMATKKEKEALLGMLVQSMIFEAVTGRAFHKGASATMENVVEVVGFSQEERCEAWDVTRNWVKEQDCSKLRLRQCVPDCEKCLEFAAEYARSRMEDRLTRFEYLQHLEGQEVISIHFEGCVGIKDGQIWQNGEVIREEPTIEVLQILLKEEFAYEFGGMTAREVCGD
jgi:hypothetical protein